VGYVTNRLAESTSPYLLQHKDNPVDWYEWGQEAFQVARSRDVPILLSVGYAACHWCHVMAHESFEDHAVAAYLNEHFVPVKVDREERPDVDAVYMEATQALTGSGGWPMTCVLTPDGEAFFCGTYFPPTDRPGMPSFGRVLEAVVDAWSTRRDEVAASAASVAQELGRRAEREIPAAPAISAEVLDTAASVLAADHNEETGGFGGAPQFPPSMVLEFLLRHAVRTGSARSLEIVATTCERMGRGGMYDQLGGGFARYSVDARWVVPHFEKMLYDNALLARVYLHWWRLTGSALARRIAVETCDWMVRDLGTAHGGFAASLDADSEGEEGRFYVWTPDEVGPDAAEIFSVTDAGTFERGRSVLQLLREPDDVETYHRERRRLLAIRNDRVAPARDDKVVAAWNGLAIAALAETGCLLDRSDLIDAAIACATMLTERHVVGGRLRRVSRDGVVGDPAGVLEDYGDLAEGLLVLHQVTGEPVWLDQACSLLDVAVAHFGDGHGGFFDTADDAERLVRRPRDPTDGATPSGHSSVAAAMLTATALVDRPDLRDVAAAAVGSSLPLVERFPRFAGWSAAAAEAYLAGPAQIAVVEDPALESIARRTTLPGAVVVSRGNSSLLAGRAAGAAYVCRGFVCDLPVSDPALLAERVGVRADSVRTS
jgi:uncharacterized protein YyaL (SSP411 family)